MGRVSGYDGEADVERFCNEVAARFLLDPDELGGIEIQASDSVEDLKDLINRFAEDRNISRKMVAYNLLRFGHIGGDTYRRLCAQFDEERIELSKNRPKSDGGPDYYVVRRHRLGSGLVGAVKRMMAGGALTTTKAGRVLGVKPTAVNRVVESSRAA